MLSSLIFHFNYVDWNPIFSLSSGDCGGKGQIIKNLIELNVFIMYIAM